MWLELKAIFTALGLLFLFTGIGLLHVLPGMYIMFMMTLGVGFYIIGDVMLGVKISNSNAHLLFDTMPNGYELGIIQSITKKITLVKALVCAEGKREFKYNKMNADVIVSGRNIIHFSNGNHGFIAHEGFDQDVDPVTCKALEMMKGDDIIEIYDNQRKKQQGS